jgi:hypothetical protein
MNPITLNIITNFHNHNDIEAINDRKRSEKIGKNRKVNCRAGCAGRAGHASLE